MKKFITINTTFNTLGYLLIIQGFLLLIPLLFVLIYKEIQMIFAFLIPSLVSISAGLILKKIFKHQKMFFLQSLIICGLSWIVLSFFSSFPFLLGCKISFIDSYFEAVSGYTTTGFTVFTNLTSITKSIIFWRCFMQWIGGIGILTFFLAILFKSNNAYFHLFIAESHKIESAKPTKSIINTVVIIFIIYILMTFSQIIILKILGLSFFDSICHSLTSVSTGGYSPYDTSINFFKLSGYKYYKLIEYTIILFMFLGGLNFLIIYKLFTGRIKDVFKDIEFRFYFFLILISTILIMLDHYYKHNYFGNFEETGRTSLFTVVSIITTTGFLTKDINDSFFPSMAKQVILMLMFIGGCVGSTSGGIKVLRAAILSKLFKIQIIRLMLPRRAVAEVVIDNKIFPDSEIKRITGLFIGWLLIITIGGFITAFMTDFDGWKSFSGMFSAVGNIGPCFIGIKEIANLPIIVKITYTFGMLAGRLEILPLLLLFNLKVWRN